MNREEARKRAEALVAQMTMEEAASQMRNDAPAIPRLGIPSYNWWNEALHGVARAGQATMFPQAIGMGATFDPELVHRWLKGTERVIPIISRHYLKKRDRDKLADDIEQRPHKYTSGHRIVSRRSFSNHSS